MADPYPSANVTRLGQYNVSAYNVSTNQYGLDDGGYIVNFPLVMEDLVAVAGWVNSYGTDFADLAAIGSDIELLADLEDGTTATGAIQAVAAVATEVATVAARDTDIGTLAGLDTEITALAGLDTELSALGALTSQLTAVGAVAGDLDAFAKSGGIVYQFASSTSGDPGAGKFGFNHSTPGNSTAMLLDDVDYYGAPAAARIDRWNNSSSAIKGTAEIVKLGDPTIRGTVEILAQVDSTGYRTVTATPVPNSFDGTIVAGDLFAITFTRNGDAGDGDIGDQIAGAVEKTTLDEADQFGIADSGDSDETKRISWANVKARFFAALGGLIAAATGKTTPVDADGLLLADSADSDAPKLLTWANLKATLFGADHLVHGQCRLVLDGGSLKVLPHQGNLITFPSGITYEVPSAGWSLAAAGLTPSTLYYVYADENGGSPQLVASTTGHSQHSSTGIEIETGDTTRVLVGMAYPVTGPAFADSATQRFVRSWFNRVPVRGNNAGSTGSASTGSTSYVEVLGTTIRIEFLAWGDEIGRPSFTGAMNNSNLGSATFTAVGLDGTALRAVIDEQKYAAYANPVCVTGNAALSEGYHYAQLLGKVSSGTGTWYGSTHGGGLDLEAF